MIKNDTREELIYFAKIAEQAERYQDMVRFMRRIVEMEGELTVEEHTLLSVAYKNAVGALRASWRIVSAIGQKEESRGAPRWKLSNLAEYRLRVEAELKSICQEILSLIDNILLPGSKNPKARAFFLKMKSDYYRYLAEFGRSEERGQFARLSLLATQHASDIITSSLRPTDPIRLSEALRLSNFFYDTLNDPARACQLAKKAFDDAILELDELQEDDYKDSTVLMQLLRDQLTLWTSDLQDGEELAGLEKG